MKKHTKELVEKIQKCVIDPDALDNNTYTLEGVELSVMECLLRRNGWKSEKHLREITNLPNNDAIERTIRVHFGRVYRVRLNDEMWYFGKAADWSDGVPYIK